jgi:hypothetical protein
VHDEMMNDTDTAKEFQNRRRKTFRIAMPLALHMGSGLAIQQFKGGLLQIVVMQDLTPFTFLIVKRRIKRINGVK